MFCLIFDRKMTDLKQTRRAVGTAVLWDILLFLTQLSSYLAAFLPLLVHIRRLICYMDNASIMVAYMRSIHRFVVSVTQKIVVLKTRSWPLPEPCQRPCICSHMVLETVTQARSLPRRAIVKVEHLKQNHRVNVSPVLRNQNTSASVVFVNAPLGESIVVFLLKYCLRRHRTPYESLWLPRYLGRHRQNVRRHRRS